MPDKVPTHFNTSGISDDYSSKGSLWTLVGGIQIMLYLIIKYSPNLDPKGNLKKYGNSFNQLRLILQLFIAAVSMIILLYVHEAIENTITVITVALAALIMLLGNYLQNVKPNYIIGFRTPWTLENEQVWRSTHRLIGRIWFFSGLGMMVALVFIPQELAIKSFVIITIVGVLVGTIHSYPAFHAIKNQ